MDEEILKREIPKLKFCVHELDRRAKSDTAHSWLWEIKKNTASKFLSAHAPDFDPKKDIDLTSIGLDAAEIDEVKEHHPLLSFERTASYSNYYKNSDWHVEFRKNLDSYVATVKSIDFKKPKIIIDLYDDPEYWPDRSPEEGEESNGAILLKTFLIMMIFVFLTIIGHSLL